MLDERDIEAGEQIEHELRERTIARISGALAGDGGSHCIDCGETIEPRRKAALPSCEKCVPCQSAHERRVRQVTR